MNTSFSREQKVLLWLACSAIFFEAFDVSIVNLALPVIAADMHIPLAAAQWVQTIYLLTFGGFLLLGGRLCDHYGSAMIFIAGMSFFDLSSALEGEPGVLVCDIDLEKATGLLARRFKPANYI